MLVFQENVKKNRKYHWPISTNYSFAKLSQHFSTRLVMDPCPARSYDISYTTILVRYYWELQDYFPPIFGILWTALINQVEYKSPTRKIVLFSEDL